MTARPRRRAATSALVVAVALGALLQASCGGNAPSTTATRTATASPSPLGTPAPAVVASLQEFIPIAEKFVVEHRHLEFLSQPKISFLDDDAFKKKLNEGQKQSKSEVEKAAKELRALGLISGDVDLGKLTDTLLGESVTGFYDSRAKELYVRGVKPTPLTRETLVHELTHVVQDQHFGIDRPELSETNDERSLAFSAVYEGDAVRIELEYRNSLSAQERAEAEREDSAGSVSPDIPGVLLDLLAFPYVAGPTFTKAVLNARGQAGLDAAFRTPPTTSAQVLHPDRYLAGDIGQEVGKPPADGVVFDDGIFGEQGLDILLRQAVDMGVLRPPAAQAASADWNGDHYVAWDNGSQSCMRVLIAAREGRGQELARALRVWTGTRRGGTASVQGTGPITLTSCG
jgi:hypothetical protein